MRDLDAKLGTCCSVERRGVFDQGSLYQIANNVRTFDHLCVVVNRCGELLSTVGVNMDKPVKGKGARDITHVMNLCVPH